jgi:hypothetical protein
MVVAGPGVKLTDVVVGNLILWEQALRAEV